MSTASDPIEISVPDVVRMKDAGEDFLLLDCREREEAQIASIGGAVLLPMSEIVDRVGELAGNEGRRIIVHCHLGGRSLRVAAWLREQGFPWAQSMAGGIDQWAVEVEPGMARY
jgi:adenylyltransferase/sulfurtransferase